MFRFDGRGGTKRASPRSVFMHGNPGRYDEGSSAALVLCLGLYCAVAAGFAFGVYELMQPSRHANPGLAAYKPPPATVIADAPPSRHADTALASAAPAEPETVGAAEVQPPPPAETAPPAPEVKQAKVERPKRQRPARRREWRDPMMNYAAQPFYYGGYRSYAAQPFYGGYRPF